MEIYHLSATELAKKIKSKEVSSKELTQMYIDRIEKFDGDINSVVVRMFDKAIQDAEKADNALSKGEDLGNHIRSSILKNDRRVISEFEEKWSKALKYFGNGKNGYSFHQMKQTN